MIVLAFIVNCFEDPMHLTGLLASLKVQWTQPKLFKIEIHVADNSRNEDKLKEIQQVCKSFNVGYHKCGGTDLYKSAELVLSKLKKVDWVCFASSDGYYVPGFSLTMLEVAHKLKSDLVYCDCLYDPRLHGRAIYSVLNTFPELRFIDKGCFIIKRSTFKGFPSHGQDWRDGALVEQLVKQGKKLDKAKGCLVVHN